MTKILVLSDTHGNFNKIFEIFNREKPDIVIAAGDGIKDVEELAYVYQDEKIKFYMVKGNCDFFNRNQEEEKLFYIENFKFFLTHGHLYSVKRNLENIKEIGKKLKADVIIYGHTHIENLEEYSKGKFLFNPGAAQDGKYGIIILNEQKIEIFNKSI